MVPDLQSAWLILIHCASARANYLFRAIDPQQMQQFAQMHDHRLWHCLCEILGIAPDVCGDAARSAATLPLVLGGLGLRSALRTREAGFWAIWADCLPMVHARHPGIAARIVRELDGQPNDPIRDKSGWQHEAASRIEQEHRESLFRVLAEPERALLRSQGGPGARAAFHSCPTCPLTRIDPALFRVLLLRRLRLPLPFSTRYCRCDRPLDSRGHHRAGCARRGFWEDVDMRLESAAARICREGGARVTTNVMIRDMDLAAPNPADGRRLEIVADGLPSFDGSQLAIDTILVSTLHCDGSARPGATLAVARRRKERTFPELVGRRGRARLVVLVGEVGGRWSFETRAFLSQLARAKSRHEPHILRQRVQQAWCSRWQAILSCAAAKAFARSLLELREAVGADGDTPASHDVLRNFQGLMSRSEHVLF